ncbi:hypothetical protein OG871_40620 (plasmid) [Kitasatospora sp. NBC_00374]|uniref:hypothetical protein n=1 Tax=Kitasatospora sp. NBC_00374 TaxID=2975964 RepID=UPI002F919516
MKRTLQKSIQSAVLRTWDPTGSDPDAGAVAVRITFPADTFRQAPSWSPGADFEACRAGQAWIRRTPEATTMVVAGVQLPLRVAGSPGGPEVWTATGPPDAEAPEFLWEEPARITELRRAPGTRVDRAPLAGHPAAAAAARWAEFEEEWGFRPERKPDGRWSLLLLCLPAAPTRPNERELVDAAALVARRFGGTAEVRPYSAAGDPFAVWRILERAAARL